MPVPELPEVESVRRMLEPMLVGQVISGVLLRRRDVVTTPDDPPGGHSRSGRAGLDEAAQPRPVLPRELLVGCRIDRIDRRGKALALVSAPVARSGVQPVLMIHLGMTGSVHPIADEHAPLGAHTHIVWSLEAGGRIGFTDPRRFGGVWCLPDLSDLEARWSALGPDALTIRAPALAAALGTSTRPLKAALLDQSVLAGVGNIYADEALFRARLSPHKLCCEVGREVGREVGSHQWATLAESIRAVLRAGIRAGGATIRDYRRPDGTAGSNQNRLAVYGRAGQACTVCGTVLSGGRLAQRATVWCPVCQSE